MSTDMIVFDEIGQLSSEELAVLDMILRQLRDSYLPFGGVLFFGSFDHMQINCIQGLPFLLSMHLLTDFTIVRLEQSVRASTDKDLQVRVRSSMRWYPLLHFMLHISVEQIRNCNRSQE